MKIYRDDGTYYKTHSSDTGFGWFFDDILIPESTPSDNKTQKKIKNEVKNKSESPSDNKTQKKIKNEVEKKSEAIDVQEAASTVDFDVSTERENIFGDVDKKIPRNQILNLINPCTIESKMLLSVVHFAMHKNFKPEMIKIEYLQDGAQVHYLKNTKDIIFDGIVNYHYYKKNNISPLLVDLILTHNKCDVHEIIENNMETGEEHLKRHPITHCWEEEVYQKYDQSGCDFLYQGIRNLFRETENLHSKISEIRYDFQEQIIRVDNLIKNAQNLEKDFREVKFLEDLIHLLNGDLQRVVLKESPFRIFSESRRGDSVNLII